MTDGVDLCAAFAAHAARTPGAPALLWHDEVTTYGELQARAAQHRAALGALPLLPGEAVGILATKSPDTIALILACLLARRPFLLPSAALPDDVLAKLFAQAGCRHILGGPPGIPELGAPAGADALPIPTDTSFMLTTSGSTGLPKIVPLGREAVHRFVQWAGETFELRPGVTVLNYAPLNFDLCLLDVWSTLAAGGRVVLVDPEQAANGRHLLDLLRRHAVDVVQAVPMFYRLVHDASSAEAPVAVRHAMFTGDVMPEQLLAELPRLLPKARLYNIYGCTETNDSFYHELCPGDGISLGRPLPGVRALLVDDDGRVVPGAGTGELLVWTPFQAVGYLDRRRYADKFGPHPAGADDLRYFRTGDIVRRDEDGRTFLVGRRDHQVKVRGVAINTAEVEHTLLRHPDVVEAAVIAEPDPLTGRRLVAHVRRLAGSRLNSLVLREHCARRLPHAAIPSVVRIVGDPLPRTSTGKVDRIALHSGTEGKPQ